VAVARSADGERFETLLTIGKEEMATESLERPALVRTPGVSLLSGPPSITGPEQADAPSTLLSEQRGRGIRALC
jgi:hypothetical protein